MEIVYKSVNSIKFTLPIFCDSLLMCRYAEMDKSVKNVISHRYKALMSLRDHFLMDQPPSPQQPNTDPSSSRNRADSQTGQ